MRKLKEDVTSSIRDFVKENYINKASGLWYKSLESEKVAKQKKDDEAKAKKSS